MGLHMGKNLFKSIGVLLAISLFILACNLTTFAPVGEGFNPGSSVSKEQVTPIELPEQWTATPTSTAAPTATDAPMPTATEDAGFSYSGDEAVTPYALEELGSGFTLRDVAIKTSDLPAGFISFAMQDLLGDMMEGMIEGMEDMFPGDMEMEGEDFAGEGEESFELDLYTAMNFTMLVNEDTGTSITSTAFLFDTEADQQQFDSDLAQPLDEPPEGFPEPEEGAEFEFGLIDGFEPVGDVSQAVEMRMSVEDESGQQSVVYSVVNFRRGPVGASLMLMAVEGAEAIDIQQLAVLLDERAAAALEAVSEQ